MEDLSVIVQHWKQCVDDLSAVAVHLDKIMDAKEKSKYATLLIVDDCVLIVHAGKIIVHAGRIIVHD